MKLTANEELVLVALENKELYGKQICEAIAACSNGAVRMKTGSLYHTLYQLEGKGFVVSRWGDGQERNSARRRYYSLSKEGRRALESKRKFFEALSNWSSEDTEH
jgi:DNA-binding PadR family transcriptional regulator